MLIDAEKARRGLIAVGVFGISLLLLTLSGPRMLAYSYLAMIPTSVPKALAQGDNIVDLDLDNARAHYLKALAWLPSDPILQQDYGRLELRRAANLGGDPDGRRVALMSASSHFRASIEAAPSRSLAWSFVAFSESQLQAAPAFLNALLRMSYYLGPHEASSLMLRARVGCGIWADLDGDVKGIIESDLQALWAVGALRSTLVDIYLSSSLKTRTSIREIVLSDPARRKIFDQMLQRALKRAAL